MRRSRPFEKDVLTLGGPRRPDFQCAGAPCGSNRTPRGAFLSLEGLGSHSPEVEVGRRSLERATPLDEREPAIRLGRGRRACRECETQEAALRSGTPHHDAQPDRTAQLNTRDGLRRLNPPGRLTESPVLHPSGGHDPGSQGCTVWGGTRLGVNCGTYPNFLR